VNIQAHWMGSAHPIACAPPADGRATTAAEANRAARRLADNPTAGADSLLQPSPPAFTRVHSLRNVMRIRDLQRSDNNLTKLVAMLIKHIVPFKRNLEHGRESVPRRGPHPAPLLVIGRKALPREY
jgi:hypothetical protein